MLQCHHHHHHLSLPPQIFPVSPHRHYHLHRHHNPSLFFTPLRKHASLFSLSALPRRRLDSWLNQLAESSTATTPIAPPEDGGPIEIPPSSPSIFATTDDPSALQVATSVLLTGAISVFLFRSIRRRVKRAKELKFRSSGAKPTLKEEALNSLNAMGSAAIEAKKAPSPVQTFLGGITAGVIALILYKFTTTIEAALNGQAISDNFSVRQITITIRTIVNGLCYLATFVFGINSVGLLLYSGQLAIQSIMGDPANEELGSKGNEQSGMPKSLSGSESTTVSAEQSGNQGDQNLDSTES